MHYLLKGLLTVEPQTLEETRKIHISIKTCPTESCQYFWGQKQFLGCILQHSGHSQSKELRQFNTYKMQSNFNLEF